MDIDHHAQIAAAEEPRLPPELECIIFKMAARNDRDRMLPVLTRVAHRVRDWLHPLRYEIIILQNSRFYERSKSPLHHPPLFPSGSQTLHVRKLLITCFVEQFEGEPEWANLLPQCHNLEELAVWTSSLTPPTISDLLSLLMPTINSPLRTVSSHGILRLSVSLAHLFPNGSADFNHEIFKHLTHLEVLNFPRECQGKWVDGNNYGCIKNLQYLGISRINQDFPFPMDILRGCLEECLNLRALIFLEHDEYTAEKAHELSRTNLVHEMPDDRVVLYQGPFNGGWTKNWYAGAVGGDDFWIQSEKVIQRKRWKREQESLVWDRGPGAHLGEWLAAMEIR